MADHALLYDADCGFCMLTVDILLRWDRHSRLRPVPIQGPEGVRLLPDLSEPERLASFHLVGPDRAVRSGGAALPLLLRLLPAGGPAAALLGASPRATDRGYHWIADHRTQLSRTIPQRLKTGAQERVSRLAAAAPAAG